MGTWVRGELANATANAVRNLPGATLNTIQNIGTGLGDGSNGYSWSSKRCRNEVLVI